MSKQFLADEEATIRFAEEFAATLVPGQIIYLIGELGAGKTCFTRGVLRALGYEGLVKSPTYTLVETYHLEKFTVLHMDLYRLKDPHELEFLGLDHYLDDPKLVAFIEWPENGAGLLPGATTQIEFRMSGLGRDVFVK